MHVYRAENPELVTLPSEVNVTSMRRPVDVVVDGVDVPEWLTSRVEDEDEPS